jgi:hypothetical protein
VSDATPTEGPQTPVQRLLAAANIQMHIASHLQTDPQPEFVDFRTPSTGHFVLEVVTTSVTAARRIAAAVPKAAWECTSDFRPGPQQDVVAWEGASMTWWDGPVRVRVIAVLDKPDPLPEVHHWVTPEEKVWRDQELAEHPEKAELLDAALDAVHRMELVGAW